MRALLRGGILMLALLRLLQDGRFHSGEELGAALGVSRSAVWKQLKVLQAELSLPLHKVRGRGYRLAAPLQLLDADWLAAQAESPQWRACVMPSVGSTNAEALRLLAGPPVPALPFYVLAERQTSGRGRRGRSWVSPFGENLYYSLVVRVAGLQRFRIFQVVEKHEPGNPVEIGLLCSVVKLMFADGASHSTDKPGLRLFQRLGDIHDASSV